MSKTHTLDGLTGRRFDGVIFDMDQTLVNSLPAIERAWTRWATHYDIPADKLANMFGLPADAVIGSLLPEHLWREALEWVEQMEIDDVEGLSAMPGALETLEALPLSRVAVATSAPERLMLARLDAAGLPRPSVLVHRGSVTHGKPAPDAFLLAAGLLGTEPHRTLVVEDAAVGIQAARSAQMGSLALLTTTPAELLPADAVVGDLAAVTWTVRDGEICVAAT